VPQVEVFFVLFCFAHNGRRKWCEKAHTAIRIHHLLIIARANTPKSGSAVDTRTSGVLHVQCCGDDGAKPRIPRHPNEGKSSHTHTHTHTPRTHTHTRGGEPSRQVWHWKQAASPKCSSRAGGYCLAFEGPAAMVMQQAASVCPRTVLRRCAHSHAVVTRRAVVDFTALCNQQG
jgi:hypothetical protein